MKGKEHANWLFLSFCRGAFGHQLGRILMTSPDVHWYDHKINGDTPWSWNHFPTEVGWQVSLGHWTRVFDLNGSYRLWDTRVKVPSAGSFSDSFYIPPEEMFNAPELIDLLNEKYVLVATHDTPEFLKSEFPNCKVIAINVADTDWVNVVKNHITASGNYRAFIDGSNNADIEEQKEWYANTYRNTMRDWQQYKMKLTEEEWIEWTVQSLKETVKEITAKPQYIDYMFTSSNRSNVDEISKIFEHLDIRYSREDIEKVLYAFNLDARISKYL